FEIDAGAEGAARSANHDDADLRLVSNELGGAIQIDAALIVHCIQQRRPVQRQITDPIPRLELHRFELHHSDLLSTTRTALPSLRASPFGATSFTLHVIPNALCTS